MKTTEDSLEQFISDCYEELELFKSLGNKYSTFCKNKKLTGNEYISSKPPVDSSIVEMQKKYAEYLQSRHDKFSIQQKYLATKRKQA